MQHMPLDIVTCWSLGAVPPVTLELVDAVLNHVASDVVGVDDVIDACGPVLDAQYLLAIWEPAGHPGVCPTGRTISRPGVEPTTGVSLAPLCDPPLLISTSNSYSTSRQNIAVFGKRQKRDKLPHFPPTVTGSPASPTSLDCPKSSRTDPHFTRRI